MKPWIKDKRAIHRDLGYFFVGLIIAFSVSGIAYNHRASWHPTKYVFYSESVEISIPHTKKEINESIIREKFSHITSLGEYKTFRFRKDSIVRAYFKHGHVSVSMIDGKGELERLKPRPILTEFTKLHMSSNDFWIWYSDFFGISMIALAITGLIMNKGKYGFKKRGIKLSLLGLIIPLTFVLFIF